MSQNNVSNWPISLCKVGQCQNFPPGAVGKNSPTNAGDTGSVPGLGRFHTPQGY